MKAISRRDFIRATTLTAATAAAGYSINAQGANERVNVGIMGVRVRGADLARFFLRHPDVRIKTLADPDANIFPRTLAYVAEEHSGFTADTTPDFRNILDDPDIDALVVAAPDHWHALATVLGCQAGKDVYVEKPTCHDIWEGRQMVAAARKYNRVVQVGTANRSMPYLAEARDYIRGADFGDIHFVRVVNQKMRPPLPRNREDQDAPEGVDYNLWLGPAPQRPFNASHFHQTWHWWWDYSGGDIMNDGIHQLDIVRYLLGQDYPAAVTANGGSYYFKDYDETPDTMAVTYEFPNLMVVYEQTLNTRYMLKDAHTAPNMDGLPPWNVNGERIDICGSKQQLCFARHGGGFEAFGAMGKTEKRVDAERDDFLHVKNFIDAVKSRETPNADILEGHRSTLLCHYANISYRLGGQRLEIDPATEGFKNSDEANSDILSRRTYREPFMVPEIA